MAIGSITQLPSPEELELYRVTSFAMVYEVEALEHRVAELEARVKELENGHSNISE